MSFKEKFLSRLIKRYEKKQITTLEEKEENYYFREMEPEKEESDETVPQEYEILEREIAPKKIICPDCGGITLEGLEFCDKCGGELTYRE